MTEKPLVENSLDSYFLALERLVKNQPTKVPKGTKITNDAVALEAGRGKGSIKKSRLSFAPLLAAIEAAVTKVSSEAPERRLDKAKSTAAEYRLAMEAGLVRELALIHELYALKKELATLRSGTVLPLRPNRPTTEGHPRPRNSATQAGQKAV